MTGSAQSFSSALRVSPVSLRTPFLSLLLSFFVGGRITNDRKYAGPPHKAEKNDAKNGFIFAFVFDMVFERF